MKYVKYLIMMFAAAAISVGCETEIDRPQLLPQDEFTAPVLSPLNDIVISSYTGNESVTFTCTPVEFGQPVQVRYEIYLTNGATDVRLVSGYTNALSVSKSDINGIAVNQLDVPANGTGEIGAYAMAYAGESTMATPKSNVIAFNVTTYRAALRTIQIVGDFNGWDSGAAPVMWETGAGTNAYRGLYDLTNSNGQFKLLTPDWTGYNSFSSVGSGIEDTDGDNHNFGVAAGIYDVYVDMLGMSITATAVSKVGAVGAWGWEDDIDFTYDPASNVWTSAKAISGEFKIRLNSAWDINYGGATKMAENMPAGVAEAYELEAGGANITLSSEKIVKLYADRTPWVIAFE